MFRRTVGKKATVEDRKGSNIVAGGGSKRRGGDETKRLFDFTLVCVVILLLSTLAYSSCVGRGEAPWVGVLCVLLAALPLHHDCLSLR